MCTIRRKDNLKKMLQMFPDDDIRETIINYADGAGEENTVNLFGLKITDLNVAFFKLFALSVCFLYSLYICFWIKYLSLIFILKII